MSKSVNLLEFIGIAIRPIL